MGNFQHKKLGILEAKTVQLKFYSWHDLDTTV